MKRKILISALIAFILASKAYSRDVLSLNCYDWENFTAGERLAYALGYLAGVGIMKARCYNIIIIAKKPINRQFADYVRRIINICPSNPKTKMKETKAKWGEGALCIALADLREKDNYISNVTAGQISDGVTNLCKDYKNKNLRIVDLIGVVLLQTRGASDEEVNAALQYLRSGRDEFKLILKDHIVYFPLDVPP